MRLPTITPVAPSLIEGIGDLAVQPSGPPDRTGLQSSPSTSRWPPAMARTRSMLLLIVLIPTLFTSAGWASAPDPYGYYLRRCSGLSIIDARGAAPGASAHQKNTHREI